jgi:hypothetical protein
LCTTYSQPWRTLDDVHRVGAMVEEQPTWTVLDGDAEEVLKRPEVLHSKLPLQGSDGAAQKL